jgi:mannose-1-phosphate guanylyltransferase
MRVMIMAAGIGTRLRPVTDLLPKPMAPIVNRPALYHILRLLHRHGFSEVVINLHHLPEVIKGYLGDGRLLGMDIRYSVEKVLLGTAGGVKKNADFLGADTFLVMSGDALTDIDLTGLVAAHRRNGSVATMAVKEVADPSLYGVVVADDDNRVVGFQEKPTLEEARSRLCNCGIYIFEPEILSHIPERQFDDFGKRLFPDLLKQDVPFHCHEVKGYWSDVGNLREFVRGNADAMAGRVCVEIPGTEIRPGVWTEDGSRIPDSAYIEPPIVVGRCCQIGEDVVIEGPTVLGDSSVLEDGAHVARALLLAGSRVPVGGLVADGVVGQKMAGQVPECPTEA